MINSGSFRPENEHNVHQLKRTHTQKQTPRPKTFDGSFALLYFVYGYIMLLLSRLSAVHGVAVAGVALFLLHLSMVHMFI